MPNGIHIQNAARQPYVSTRKPDSATPNSPPTALPSW